MDRIEPHIKDAIREAHDDEWLDALDAERRRRTDRAWTFVLVISACLGIIGVSVVAALVWG